MLDASYYKISSTTNAFYGFHLILLFFEWQNSGEGTINTFRREKANMIGRENEVQQFKNLYLFNKAELVAVYGRRVGKTYLINEVFHDRFFFKHSGLSLDESDNNKTKTQLEHFANSLNLHGIRIEKKIENWFDAFLNLTIHINRYHDFSKKVIFIDELPWLDTKGSQFISAFEGFWNSFACARNDLLIIVCGSATSWIENNLINNTGGLYGRVSYEIKLNPFNLKECKEFLESKGVNYSLYDITQAYMVFGGIPYYLNCIDKRYSLAQNIDNLFINNNVLLLYEFDRLFNSIFSFNEKAKTIVKLLATNSLGLTRDEIAKKLNISDGSTFSKYLNSLIASNLITKYVPFGFSKREPRYKLVDPFCIFYIKFVLDKSDVNNFFEQETISPKLSSWRGLAFENVCFNHIDQIKFALGIQGVSTTISAFFNKDDGYQIDLVIDRRDNIINLCEIKFYSDLFKITKDYHLKINRRANLVKEKVSKKYSIMNTLISTYGIYSNEYYYSFTNSIVLEDLFRF